MRNSILSGFSKLDELTTGFYDSELYVIGSRASVGKSSFLQNIMYNICAKQKIAGLFFSVEMAKEKVIKRFSKLTNLDSSKEMQDWRLVIDDEPNVKIDTLCEKARKLHAENSAHIIFIDGLGLIGTEDENRPVYETVFECVRKLKFLARELKIPVLVTCALARGIDDEPPSLSQLRGTGSIEEYADAIILLHRKPDAESEATAIVAKNTNAPVRSVPLTFTPGKYLFAEKPNSKSEEKQGITETFYEEIFDEVVADEIALCNLLGIASDDNFAEKLSSYFGCYFTALLSNLRGSLLIKNKNIKTKIRSLSQEEFLALKEPLEKIREGTFCRLEEIYLSFNDLKRFPDRAIQKILREVDTPSLALALKGAEKSVVKKIFANLSKRAAEMFKDDMDFMAEASKEEIISCQKTIMQNVWRLIENGEISLDFQIDYDESLGRNTFDAEAHPYRYMEKEIIFHRNDFWKKEENAIAFKKAWKDIALLCNRRLKNGLLDLEDGEDKLTPPFLRRGILMILDGGLLLELAEDLWDEQDKDKQFLQLFIYEGLCRIKCSPVYMPAYLDNVWDNVWGDFWGNFLPDDISTEARKKLDAEFEKAYAEAKNSLSNVCDFEKKLLLLDDQKVQKLVVSSDLQDLAFALKAVSPEAQEKVFRNMSKKSLQELRENMEFIGPVSKGDSLLKQTELVQKIYELDEHIDARERFNEDENGLVI